MFCWCVSTQDYTFWIYLSSVHNYNCNIYFIFVTMITLITIWNTLTCVGVFLCYCWLFIYPCFQCISALKLMSLTSSHGKMYMVKLYVIKQICQWLMKLCCFYPETAVSLSNKSDLQDIAKTSLKKCNLSNVFTLKQHKHIYQNFHHTW
jgi:hypothetical protein